MTRIDPTGDQNSNKDLSPFRTLVEQSPDLIARFDQDLRYLYVNPAARHTSGLSELFVGKTNRELGLPENLAELWESTMRRVLETGQEQTVEFAYPTPEGERIFEARFAPEQVTDAGVRTILAIARDVTERREKERQIAAAKTFLEKTLSSIGEAVFVIDPADRTIVTCNDAVEQIFGYSKEDLLGQNTRMIHVSDESYVHWEVISEVVLDERGHFHTEYQMRREDGRVIQTEHTITPLGDDWQAGVVSVVRDISERKRAESALRESEERYRQLVDLAPDMIIVYAPEKILYINRAGVDFLGLESSEEVVSQPLSRLVSTEEAGDMLARMRQYLAGESERRRVEETITLHDGRTRDIEISSAPVTYEGQPARQVIVRDITERKRAEAALRKAHQHMRALSQRLVRVQEEERRHIARELHDEIGQGLTGVKMSLEMSRRQHADEHLQEALELIGQLTIRVRDLSLNLRPSMLDDLGLVPTLLWHIERYSAQTGVKVRFHHNRVSGRFTPEIETTAFRVVQEALTNVARHAEVDLAEVQAWADEQHLYVQIEDQGVGFDPAVVESPAQTGGLSGMRERVALLDGEFKLTTAPGEGTQILVKLPLANSAPREGTS